MDGSQLTRNIYSTKHCKIGVELFSDICLFLLEKKVASWFNVLNFLIHDLPF